jgi:predicted Zn-dependent protease
VKKILSILCLSVILAGCQQPGSDQSKTVNTERQDAAKKLFAQGMLSLQQKDLKGAVESLENSIKADPSDPNPYLVLGQILIKAEEFDHAVEFLDQTAKNFPDNGAIFYMLSVANKMDGKILPAVLAARRSFEIFKASGDMDNAKGSAILLEELIKVAQDQQGKAQGTAQAQMDKPQAAVKK